MSSYMVIETFIDGAADRVYRRFEEKGRMLPDGLFYVDSWLAHDGSRCFQLMQTESFGLFGQWTANWDDLVRFEIVELGSKPVGGANEHIDKTG